MNPYNSEQAWCLLLSKEYVEFLIGRDGEFDQLVASAVRRCKRAVRDDNSSLVLVLPYATAEYLNNEQSFHEYYDAVEICEEAAGKHFKSSHQTRNRAKGLAIDCYGRYIESIDADDAYIFLTGVSSE